MQRTKPSEHLAVEKPGIVFADLSNNQGSGTFHAETYCRTHPFLVHKATQGTGFKDDQHAARCEETHTHGRAVGHYMFLQPLSTPVQAVEEAQFFVETVRGHVLTQWPNRSVGYKTDFFVLDLEVNCTQPNQIIRNVWKVLQKAFPTVPFIGYSGLARIQELGLRMPTRIPRWWVAAYPGPVGKLPNGQLVWSHQYTDKGRVQGIGLPCDKSIIVDKHAREYWSSGTHGNK